MNNKKNNFCTIKIKEALNLENHQIIDTRTPNEFKLDHLPNAINIPIFSNEERAMIGTLYKQVSKDEAIKKGVKFFGINLPHIIEQINQHRDKILIIQCWRGGMRSKVLTALLKSLNYQVLQLEGGYKTYRAYIRKQLEKYNIKPKLVVLHGLTGTGKTELIKLFKNHIDLEKLAKHRGSSYGSIGLEPNNQKNFENLLWQKLEQLKKEQFIIVEGESKRIGNVIIPEFFWKTMKESIKINITRTLNNRSQAIVKEYFKKQEHVQKIKDITLELKKNISNKRKNEVINLIKDKKYSDAVKILLTDYYDPLYKHSLDNLEYGYIIKNDNLKLAKKKIDEILIK